MRDSDQKKLRVRAEFIELLAGEFFEPATVDPNRIHVSDGFVATAILRDIPLVPVTETVTARYSPEDHASIVFRDTRYDTVQDVQDAYFNLYGLDEDELEDAIKDQARPIYERSHASLMLARDSCYVINRCGSCGFYFDNYSYANVCPHCGFNHTITEPVTRVDEYGTVIS